MKVWLLSGRSLALAANYPIRAGHAWEQDCAGPDIYTEDGQLGLPITPEMLLSG